MITTLVHVQGTTPSSPLLTCYPHLSCLPLAFPSFYSHLSRPLPSPSLHPFSPLFSPWRSLNVVLRTKLEANTPKASYYSGPVPIPQANLTIRNPGMVFFSLYSLFTLSFIYTHIHISLLSSTNIGTGAPVKGGDVVFLMDGTFPTFPTFPLLIPLFLLIHHRLFFQIISSGFCSPFLIFLYFFKYILLIYIFIIPQVITTD